MSEIAEVEVNEQDVETEGAVHRVEDDDQLVAEKGRKEEMDCMVLTLKMFGCDSWEWAAKKARNDPTTMKWVDGEEER